LKALCVSGKNDIFKPYNTGIDDIVLVVCYGVEVGIKIASFCIKCFEKVQIFIPNLECVIIGNGVDFIIYNIYAVDVAFV